MSDLSSSSFIPKRGPVKRKRGGSSRHIYIFTILSYILMFAALLATGGVFLYSGYIDRQLDEEVTALNNEVSGFSEANMQEVMEFDRRLSQAFSRLSNTVSLPSVFAALEAATIDTVQIESLDLVRENDDKFIITANIKTDSFDSTIFQRDVYEQNQEKVTSVTLSEVNYSEETPSRDEVGRDDSPVRKQVSFTAELEVPLWSVPYVAPETTLSQPITITDPVVDPALQSTDEVDPGEEDNNEENI